MRSVRAPFCLMQLFKLWKFVFSVPTTIGQSVVERRVRRRFFLFFLSRPLPCADRYILIFCWFFFLRCCCQNGFGQEARHYLHKNHRKWLITLSHWHSALRFFFCAFFPRFILIVRLVFFGVRSRCCLCACSSSIHLLYIYLPHTKVHLIKYSRADRRKRRRRRCHHRRRWHRCQCALHNLFDFCLFCCSFEYILFAVKRAISARNPLYRCRNVLNDVMPVILGYVRIALLRSSVLSAQCTHSTHPHRHLLTGSHLHIIVLCLVRVESVLTVHTCGSQNRLTKQLK